MKERSFLDTNILIYTDDKAYPEKKAIAEDLLVSNWNQGTGVLSTQVLQEYFSAATRKLGLSIEVARKKIELLAHLEIISIQHIDILNAIDLHRLHAFSFWDALIVSMAQKSACRVLLTEDMQHGQKIGDLKIINPFLS